MNDDYYMLFYKETPIAGFAIDEFSGNCGYRILFNDWADISRIDRAGVTVKDVASILLYLICHKHPYIRMLVFSDFQTNEGSLAAELLEHQLVNTSDPVLQNSAALWTNPEPSTHIRLGYFSPFNLMHIKRKIPPRSSLHHPNPHTEGMITRYTRRQRMIKGLKPILPEGISIKDFVLEGESE
ncbi:MAG: hypothetical protein GWO28_01240 [candidate division Zixibacteria bacterium]|nr:hypothetical protein [candidate division Zixibacteria bacterium]